jgi:hypothetical protein
MIIYVFWQVQIVVDSVWAYDDEATEVYPGENVKIKLKNVEEDVSCIVFGFCKYLPNFQWKWLKNLINLPLMFVPHYLVC